MEQSLNFEMLRSQWPELAELASMAERYVHSDPESCLVKLRNYTELMVRQERLPEGIKANLYDLMNADVFTSMMPEDIDSTLSAMVKTKKTELLFLARILQMLKVGGRSATIVPQGVLFGSSKAHQLLRKTLVEDNQLEAVINLPSGVFKPYAGVATAILIFTKGGQTDEVWFYDLQNDGYSLDDKRNPIKENDLPHLLASWKCYRALRGLPVDNFMGEKLALLLKQQYPQGVDAGVDFKDRTQSAFVVPKGDIATQKYDLSINRYKEMVYQAEVYEDPKVILKRLKDLEKEILADLDELEGML